MRIHRPNEHAQPPNRTYCSIRSHHLPQDCKSQCCQDSCTLLNETRSGGQQGPKLKTRCWSGPPCRALTHDELSKSLDGLLCKLANHKVYKAAIALWGPMYGTEDPREDLKSKGVKTLLGTQDTGLTPTTLPCQLVTGYGSHQQHRHGGRSRPDQCHSYDQASAAGKMP